MCLWGCFWRRLVFESIDWVRGLSDGSDGKESACNARDQVPYLGQEDPLEKAMATQCSCLANFTCRRAWQATGYGCKEVATAKWLVLVCLDQVKQITAPVWKDIIQFIDCLNRTKRWREGEFRLFFWLTTWTRTLNFSCSHTRTYTLKYVCVYTIHWGGHGNLLQYSCLENPMDRGPWQATVHRIAKSWTRLKRLSMHTIHL